MGTTMKLNRWQLDKLHDLVASDIHRVTRRRRECLNTLGDDTDIRRELSDLILLRVKLDRLRKKNDLQKAGKQG